MKSASHNASSANVGAFRNELLEIFDPTQVLQSAEQAKPYGSDWNKEFQGQPLLVVFPKNASQVQELVRLARKHKQALVPSGGRTGLSGGAAAMHKEVVVSFEKMNKILSFNEEDLTVVCEAGVTLQALQEFALTKDYEFPVDLGARGSCHIGGNIATNAGGIRVVRYGNMRNWVTGLEAVLGTGDLVELNRGLTKNATGYDFRNLLTGSEGTLGLITKAELRLTQKENGVAPSLLLLALPDLASTFSIFKFFRKKSTLFAFEVFTQEGVEFVQSLHQLKPPFETTYPVYAVIECGGDAAAIEALLGEAMEFGAVLDGRRAQSSRDHEEFWMYRELIPENLSQQMAHKNDISLKISKIADFLAEFKELIGKYHPEWKWIWFGHLGDGNLHLNILKTPKESFEDFKKASKAFDLHTFALVQKLQGSISAEHGVGLLKKPFLHFSRSPIEIELMKQIKAAFDPEGILNPGKIF